MTLLLLMAGVAGLSGFALNNLEQIESGQASLLHVYIRDGAPSPDVNSLWDRLAADPRVARVDYVTRAQALERAQTIPGLPQLADASQSNPFPASLDVQVKSIDDVAAIAATSSMLLTCTSRLAGKGLLWLASASCGRPGIVWARSSACALVT